MPSVRKTNRKFNRSRDSLAAPREIYQLGSGYVVVESASRLGTSGWEVPAGFRVLSAICDELASTEEAASLGRTLAEQVDRFAIVVDGTKGTSMHQWAIADAFIAAGAEAAPRITALIANDCRDALRRMMATMADDEVIFLFTRDAAGARATLMGLEAFPTDEIEAKPQSMRRPLWGEESKALPLAG